MKDSDYPGIDVLNAIYVKHKVETKMDRSELLGGKPYYPLVRFKLGGQEFKVFVDDEYDDLRKNYPLLNLCLVLRELEGYDFATDYIVWCQERGLDSSNEQVKEGYEHLGAVYKQVEDILGEVNSQVSDFDFEMNARAAQRLRKDP